MKPIKDRASNMLDPSALSSPGPVLSAHRPPPLRLAQASPSARVFETLTALEKRTLELRFADTQDLRSLADVAQLLGVSVDTVAQVERQALRKLRASAVGPIASGFDGWDDA